MPSRDFFIGQSILQVGTIETWRKLFPLIEARPDFWDASYTIGLVRDEFKHQVAKYGR